MLDACFHNSASLLPTVGDENHNSVTSTDCKYSTLYTLALHWWCTVIIQLKLQNFIVFIVNVFKILSNPRGVREGAIFVAQPTFSFGHTCLCHSFDNPAVLFKLCLLMKKPCGAIFVCSVRP